MRAGVDLVQPGQRGRVGVDRPRLGVELLAGPVVVHQSMRAFGNLQLLGAAAEAVVVDAILVQRLVAVQVGDGGDQAQPQPVVEVLDAQDWDRTRPAAARSNPGTGNTARCNCRRPGRTDGYRAGGGCADRAACGDCAAGTWGPQAAALRRRWPCSRRTPSPRRACACRNSTCRRNWSGCIKLSAEVHVQNSPRANSKPLLKAFGSFWLACVRIRTCGCPTYSANTLSTPSRRAVVDDDQLEVAIGLRQHAFHGAAQHGGVIVDGQHHADQARDFV